MTAPPAIHLIDAHTLLHGIIGDPVSHSLSPAMHNAAFAALGINAVYVPMRCSDAAEAVVALRTLGFTGVSVTIPHKEKVMAALDEIDPPARRIGAVNTLLFRKTGEDGQTVVRGFNTDWLGANRALAEIMDLRDSRVVLLGAGGAARAVAFGLVEAGARVTIVNRSEDKGRDLAAWLGCQWAGFNDVARLKGEALINTTSVGMTPGLEETPLPAGLLGNYQVVMDIVYSPLQTRLLREAAAAGCKIVDGLAMLLYQGAAQFKIWTGRNPPLAVMRSALEEALAPHKNTFTNQGRFFL